MTQYARPDSNIDAGGWTDDMAMDDASYTIIDQDPEGTPDCSVYIKRADDGSDATAKFGLQNVTDPESASDHKVVVRAGGTVMMSAVPELTYALYQGASTQIATKTFRPADGSFANNTLTLSSTQANNITDYTDLRIWLTCGDEGGMGDEDHVCQAWFECPDAASAATTSPSFLLFT
jgi:hypothetical protein